MSKTNGAQSLGEKIQKVVQEHLEQLRAEAAHAVQEALPACRAASPSPRVKTVRAIGRRRGQTEVAELAEKFFAAVSETPGETMVTLAARVGESPRQLHRPVANLKQAGRIRSVGERQRTRYFPLAAGAGA